tara:strand:- start:60547 stop:60900 length:354 start_codon:yes stop_codon:yes gene_type:complete
MIKSFLEEEAQGIVIKFCLAMVCLSVLIFSLFQLGYAFQTWVAQYKDAFQMSCVMFSSTLLLSLLGMYFLFSKRTPEVDENGIVDVHHPLMGMSLQEKGFTFVRGLIDGLVNGRSTQ